MRPGVSRSRGVALLLVLGVLVLVVPAIAALANSSGSAVATRAAIHDAELATELCFAARQAIEHWLKESADAVVLPPTVTVPRALVLDDEWETIEGTMLRLKIAAFDQFGMVPLHAALAGHPLRLAVRDDVLHRLSDLDSSTQATGLDSISEQFRLQDDVYPRIESLDNVTTLDSAEELTRPLAIGSAIAIHNPLRSSSNRGRTRQDSPERPVVNVNTAPLELVRTALRLAGRGGAEVISESRAARSLAAVPEGDRRTGPMVPGSCGTE